MVQLLRKERRVATEWQLAAFASVLGLDFLQTQSFCFRSPCLFRLPSGPRRPGVWLRRHTGQPLVLPLARGAMQTRDTVPLAQNPQLPPGRGTLSSQRGGWRQGHPFSLLILAKTLSTCKPSPLWGIWGLLVILPLPPPKTPAQNGFLGLNGW